MHNRNLNESSVHCTLLNNTETKSALKIAQDNGFNCDIGGSIAEWRSY